MSDRDIGIELARRPCGFVSLDIMPDLLSRVKTSSVTLRARSLLMVGPGEGSSVDKSVSFLLIGLAVAAFMLLTILGMQQYESNAEKIRETPPSVPSPEIVIDFGE